MINCPKCNELIGEKHVICPICRYEFPVEDIINIKKMMSDRENKIYYHKKEIREEAAKKRVRYLAAMFIALFLPIIIGFVLYMITKNIRFIEIFSSLGLAAEVIVVIIGQIKGVYRCPFCDRTLMRYYGPYCHNCGEKL